MLSPSKRLLSALAASCLLCVNVGCTGAGPRATVSVDPATGLPTVALWWCPESGQCALRPFADAERVESPLTRTPTPPE